MSKTASLRLRCTIMNENGGGRAGLSEPLHGDRVEAGNSAVASDPEKQSGPRCVEVSFFVAPGNREHAWQCLDCTCSVTVATW
jgi:hypothetical protein